ARRPHLPPVFDFPPNPNATASLSRPSAHAKTIRLRNASRCSVRGRRAHRSSWPLSPPDSTNTSFGRPVRAIFASPESVKDSNGPLHHLFPQLQRQDTRSSCFRWNLGTPPPSPPSTALPPP